MTVIATVWRRLFFAYLATRGNHRTLHCLKRGKCPKGPIWPITTRLPHPLTSPPHKNTHIYVCLRKTFNNNFIESRRYFLLFFAIRFTAFLHKISADLKSNRLPLTLIKNFVTWRLYYPGFFCCTSMQTEISLTLPAPALLVWSKLRWPLSSCFNPRISHEPFTSSGSLLLFKCRSWSIKGQRDRQTDTPWPGRHPHTAVLYRSAGSELDAVAPWYLLLVYEYGYT